MITADPLKLPGISHGFFTRQGGVSLGIFSSLNCGLGSGDDRAAVVENRGRVASRLGVAANNLLSLYQVHGVDVVTVSQSWTNDEVRPKADAMVTATPGLALGILTADCGPLLFADAQAGVVGCAHAGWKGALNNVAGATIRAMEKLGATRDNIVAVLGPTISQSAYEVGPEFYVPFIAADRENAEYFVPSIRDRHFMFNLPEFLAHQLRHEHVTFHDLRLCTYSDAGRFFSYRRSVHRTEIDYGRLISAIALG
jgi:polyphenol oxidase